MVEPPRVLIALPNAVESATVAERLAADGLELNRRSSPTAAAEAMRAHAFDVLIADAAFAFQHGLHILGRARNPLMATIVIGDVPAARTGDMGAGQIMYLSRPIDCATLACFVSLALVDGRPVRRSVRKPVNRFEASINGIPSFIVDVSAEGLRLEISRERRVALPPYFTVRVPLVGVSVTVRRMWTLTSSGSGSSIWYGGELSHNRAAVDQAWRTFVDTMPVAVP